MTLALSQGKFYIQLNEKRAISDTFCPANIVTQCWRN